MNPGFIDRGGRWVIGQCALMLAVAGAGPLWPGELTGRARWLAGLLLVVGGVIGTSGAVGLRKNRTIFPRPNEDSHLVRTGVYRWVRHPLYASVIALSAAWATFWASWPAAVAGLGLAAFLCFKAAREERWLVAKFPEYEEYRRRTKRLIPGLF